MWLFEYVKIICIIILNISIELWLFIDYGINSILFQRGLYPPESFKGDENYGLTILMSTDNKIKEFLSTTLEQLKGMKRQIYFL